MSKSDRIKITDLHLRAIIGINPDERKNLQDVLINIVLYVDSRPAAESDDIYQTQRTTALLQKRL